MGAGKIGAGEIGAGENGAEQDLLYSYTTRHGPGLEPWSKPGNPAPPRPRLGIKTGAPQVSRVERKFYPT